jgi:small-conductance mechanosensitive channel
VDESTPHAPGAEAREQAEALAQQEPSRAPDPPAPAKASVGALLFVAMVALACRIALPFLGVLSGPALDTVGRTLLGAFATCCALIVARITTLYGVRRLRNAATRYNVGRVVQLATVLAIAFIAVSVFFQNWYGAAVSLGLASLILGFALQTPITSFIGWIYILVRGPFRVGDRVRIGDVTGDVIDIGYLDTTLWEFGGEYLSTDHPSGRVVRFPNASVLGEPVYNYTWPLFPYIWNELKLQVAYQSDLGFIEQTVAAILREEVGEEMTTRVAGFRRLLEKTPVNHLEVRAEPAVFFRVSENTWLEMIARYLVDPRQAGHVKSRILPRVLAALNAAPDKVMFPKGDSR